MENTDTIQKTEEEKRIERANRFGDSEQGQVKK
jgi:hypothetical protein